MKKQTNYRKDKNSNKKKDYPNLSQKKTSLTQKIFFMILIMILLLPCFLAIKEIINYIIT